MQISIKGKGNLVRVHGGLRYSGFKLKGLYCMLKPGEHSIVKYTAGLTRRSEPKPPKYFLKNSNI